MSEQTQRETADLLIVHAGQLVTIPDPGRPLRGAQLGEPGLIRDGAVAVRAGRIAGVGTTAELERRFTADQISDAGGRVVCPGFVDCHTHAVWAGDRLDDFERRCAGATYQEIMAAGGGILSTMRATRAAAFEQLLALTLARLDEMLACGATTVEIKTGYGLEAAAELQLLAVIEAAAARSPLDIAPTFLGAHAVPPEFAGRPDGWVDVVADDLLPRVADWYAGSLFAQRGVPCGVDVFCENHAFDLAQSARVLRAGAARGLRPKIHADQFTALGGARLAAELGALSADHLDVTPAAERRRLAQSPTIAVLLPAVTLNLGSCAFPDARAWIADGAAIALATDFNPGSAPCPSLPLVMGLGCRYLRLTPAEALAAVTLNAAYALGLADRLGSLTVGKQADCVILEADDYREAAYWLGGGPRVRAVVKQGRVVYGVAA